MSKQKRRYFLTVDWCSMGNRGIFCSDEGQGFSKDNLPHTEEEMSDILGPFHLILAPRSELLTEEQVKEFNRWIPLAEYSNKFGVALRLESSGKENTK
jgi:hypothetical protein